MRELSRLLEKDNQSVFFSHKKRGKKENKIKSTKKGKNVMEFTDVGQSLLQAWAEDFAIKRNRMILLE